MARDRLLVGSAKAEWRKRSAPIRWTISRSQSDSSSREPTESVAVGRQQHGNLLGGRAPHHSQSYGIRTHLAPLGTPRWPLSVLSRPATTRASSQRRRTAVTGCRTPMVHTNHARLRWSWTQPVCSGFARPNPATPNPEPAQPQLLYLESLDGAQDRNRTSDTVIFSGQARFAPVYARLRQSAITG